jgi:acetyltransferase-like isoleucine patch superfamily enzyme
MIISRLINGILYVSKGLRRLKMYCYRFLFKDIGRKVIFDPRDDFSYSTISIGSNVFIGPGAKFSATESGISIGNKVMFGPNVTIMGGDHNTSKVGQYMYDIHEKRPEDDLYVIIEDDCWVGAGAIILKGVTLKTGTIVAAGSIVVKSTEPYSVVGGNPAKKLKSRFSNADLDRHIKLLGES